MLLTIRLEFPGFSNRSWDSITAVVMTGQALRDTQDQSNVLSRKRTTIIFVALALTLFISVLDQTSVSTSLPAIGKDLDAVSTISWVQPFRTCIEPPHR